MNFLTHFFYIFLISMINLLYNESNISFIKNKRKKESLGHTAIFHKYHFQN